MERGHRPGHIYGRRSLIPTDGIAAIDLAKARHNPELTPDHLLVALADQDGTIVAPVLAKLGQSPGMVRDKAIAAVERLPSAIGGDEPRLSRELNAVADRAEQYRKDLKDDYVSVEHLLLAMNDRLNVGSEELLAVLSRLDFLAVWDLIEGPLSARAHLTLPAASAFEKDGPWINETGRLQRVRPGMTVSPKPAPPSPEGSGNPEPLAGGGN